LKLFEPFNIRGVILRNRVVFPPCDTNYATEEGYLSQRLIDHYSRVAEGGAGLIIVENTNVNPEPRAKARPLRLCAHDDPFISFLGKLAEIIHSQGARAALHLVDMSLRATNRKFADLTIEEIHQLVGYFADAADRGRQTGFDAVEFHMAHSYTLVSR
jgi:2,4-dienoyl-CoA reductase-like NADH-dependent reductase (Old Yellow Enzyme family)